jgi:hypothetical protein
MITKIISTSLLISCLAVIFILFIRFLKETRKHNKRMTKLNEWSKFHKQLVEWASEISDVTIRQQYMNECVGKLISHNSNNIDLIDNFSIEKEKEVIYKKWGQYIPSLLQEVRQSRLEKLL